MPGLMCGDVEKRVLDFDQCTRLKTGRREPVPREECLTGYDRYHQAVINLKRR